MSNFPEQIQKRIDAGMGCGSEIGDGWMDIVVELDAKLAITDPDYVIDQIKEKFGGLRYYVSNADSDEAYDAIDLAEQKAAITCDVCGKPGKMRHGSWMVTRCDEHDPYKDKK